MRRATCYAILAAAGAIGLMLAVRPARVEAAKTPRDKSAARHAMELATTSPTTSPTTGPTTMSSTTGPSSKPSTSSAATQSAAGTKPFPKEFSLLLTRSLFARGAAPSGKPSGEPMPGGPEANLGLRGVLVLDGKFTAIIEDMGSKHAQQVKAGDPIGPGKVKSITIDAIDYQNGATSRQVAIGQNLLGMPLPAQPPPAPKPPPGGQPGQGQPGQPGGPQQGGPPPEVMKMMRRGK